MASGVVLLIEDDPYQQRVYTRALESAGYTVTIGDNGEAAPRLCDLNGPRLIILDISLPGISGIEACKRIRRQYPVNVPIVFVTGTDKLEAMREGIEAGGDDFMVKGANIQAYLERVGYWMTRSCLTDQERIAILQKVGSRLQDDPGARVAPSRPEARREATAPPAAERPASADRLLSELAATDWGTAPAPMAAPANRRADPALVASMAAFVAKAQASASPGFGALPSEKFALLGYAAGVVNALANSNLEVKMRFVPYLRALLIETMPFSPTEIESSVGRWYTMYRVPVFSAACSRGEEDYARMLQGVADAAPTPIASLLTAGGPAG